MTSSNLDYNKNQDPQPLIKLNYLISDTDDHFWIVEVRVHYFFDVTTSNEKSNNYKYDIVSILS